MKDESVPNITFQEPFDVFGRWRTAVAEANEAEAKDLLETLGASEAAGVALLCKASDRALADGKVHIADARLNEAAILAPDNPWVQFEIGNLRLRQSRDLDAAAHFELGLQTQDHPAFREITAKIRARDAEKQASLRAAQSTIAKADDLLGKGNFKEADSLLLSVAAQGFFLDTIDIKRANIAINFGELDRAEALLDKAGRIDGKNPWIFYNLGLIHETRGAFEHAIACMQNALEQIPDNVVFTRNLKRYQAQLDAGIEIRRAFHRITRSAEAANTRKPPLKVIAWDLSHNPAGRAAVLADVAAEFAEPELVGPVFPQMGTGVWPPMAEAEHRYDIVSWDAHDTTRFFEGAIHYVLNNPCDRVWISKPRFPSMFLGFLYKLLHDAWVVVDIDDDELAFAGAETGLGADAFIMDEALADWSNITSQAWTRLAQSMIEWADGVTVCNEVLQSRYGGEIVRHARSAEVFRPDDVDVSALKADLGLSDENQVVLFMGTPRRHKGVLEVAQAVAELRDPNVVLLVVGSFPEPGLKAELNSIPNVRLVLLEDQPLSRTPGFNALADVSCAVQDMDDRVAQSQTPAKLSDAAAMGTLAITSDLDTVAPFVVAGAAITSSGRALVDTLRAALEASKTPESFEKARTFFVSELSLEANAPRAEARFAASGGKPAPIAPAFRRLLDIIARRLPRKFEGDLAAFWQSHTDLADRQVGFTGVDDPLDIVFFWKQNDTGLYQRRQDAMHETLARLPNVRRVLHIDVPLSVDRLDALSNLHGSDPEGNYIAQHAIARHLKAVDKENIHYRTFIHAGRNKAIFGDELPKREMFPIWVRRWMEELDIGKNVMAWVCPVVPEFQAVQECIDFKFIVADFIDDQRQWPMLPATRRRLNLAYDFVRDTCNVSFANCQPVVDWLEGEGLKPLLVPNGLELPQPGHVFKRPIGLEGVPGPIVGYVGNMNDRIDWGLLLEIAQKRPDWCFVFIGNTARVKHGDFSLFQALDNVLFPGVVPFAQVGAWVNAFDVAVIPHLNDALSKTMNPLKLFVYRSFGVRVVSTRISNIGHFGDEVVLTSTAQEMEDAIALAIADNQKNGKKLSDPDLLSQCLWSKRVDDAMTHIRAVWRAEHVEGTAE